MLSFTAILMGTINGVISLVIELLVHVMDRLYVDSDALIVVALATLIILIGLVFPRIILLPPDN